MPSGRRVRGRAEAISVSLRARMGLAAGVAVAIAVVAVAVSAYAGPRSELQGQLDNSLSGLIHPLLLRAGVVSGPEPGAGPGGDGEAGPPPGFGGGPGARGHRL